MTSPLTGAVLASIPSPSFNSLDVGPLSLNLYGLMIALGVVAAVWMFGRRLFQRGIGTRTATGVPVVGFAGRRLVLGDRLV